MTNDQSPILVFGATGRQGGSVAKALLKARWPVRALVGDPDKSSSLALKCDGVELVRGSFEESDTIEGAMQGVHGVFSVLPGNLSAEDEMRYGTSIADLAVKNRVNHFIYSSGASVSKKLTGVPRFDAKRHIEAYVAGLPLTATIVRPMIFMEMLTRPGFGLEHGHLFSLIRKEGSIQLIAVDDIGKIVASLFADKARFGGETLKIASDRLTGYEIEAALSEAAGRPITYARFPDDVLAANADLALMASSLDNGPLAEIIDLNLMRELNPELLSFKSWLAGSGREELNALILRGTGKA